MELFTLMGKFITNGKEASSDIDKVTGTAQKSESKIGSAMKKIGGAIVTAFAVQKVIAFGKQMIESAAKIKAMGAQFDQVFGTDASAAMSKIKDQSKELGIHVDRLTTSWNSFGAQTKGAGMSAEASMAATEKATKLAADSAAFYDTSMETASASIASFMKGNFAAGDAIGVFTNAKQMDAKSMDMYNKKWQDLTESERQNLLLDTVEKTYELNGAMGQAARESNSWENVTGNLKATWDRFMATLGSPILAGAVQVVGLLTQGIEWLQEKIGTVSWSSVTEGNPAFEKIKALADDVVNFFITSWPMIKDTFMIVWDTVKNIWDTVAAPVFDTAIRIVGLVWEYFKAAWPAIMTVLEVAFLAIQTVWNNVLKPVFNFIMAIVNAVLDIFEENMPKIQAIFSSVSGAIKVVWDTIIKPVFDAVGKAVGTLVSIFTEKIPGIQTTLSATFGKVLDIMKKPFDTAKEKIGGIVDKIKGFMDFKWEWPTLKMPKFTISGSANPLKWITEGVPKLNVSWNALGGIFTKPTILNTVAGLQGFAEPSTGGEAILPLNKLVPIMSEAMRSLGVQNDTTLFAKMIDLLSIIASKNPNVYLDKKIVSRELYPEFDRALKNDIEKENWEFA